MTDEDSYADDIAERIRLAAAGGYDSKDQVLEDLSELIEYDPDAADYVAGLGMPLDDHLRALLDAAWSEHLAAQAGFPEVTDCDRLTQVFTELEASGILAGEDVGMTMSDVRDDMWQALEEERGAGRTPRGWVAFHRQHLDRVVDTGTLCLAYAAETDQDEDFVVIAQEIADAFRAADFQVEWDGSPSKRIELVGVRWQKRR